MPEVLSVSEPFEPRTPDSATTCPWCPQRNTVSIQSTTWAGKYCTEGMEVISTHLESVGSSKLKNQFEIAVIVDCTPRD